MDKEGIMPSIEDATVSESTSETQAAEQTAVEVKKRSQPQKKRKRKFSWKKTLIIYAIMLPGLIYLVINNIIPMYGITIAFRKPDLKLGYLNSPFYGFGELSEYSFFYNFELLFSSNQIWTLIRNTVLYNVVFSILGIVIPVTVAIFFNVVASKVSKKVFQTAILLPNIISWVIVSYLVYAFLGPQSGVFTKMTGADYYHTPAYWPFILTFLNVWKGVGFGMVVYVASLVGIDPALYEAAKLDGANFWQRTLHITLPSLKKMIITLSILNVSKIMASDFGLFYQVTQNVGTLYEVTQTLDVYIYNALKVTPNIAASSAVSVFQSLVGLILVVTANFIVKKVDKEDAIF